VTTDWFGEEVAARYDVSQAERFAAAVVEPAVEVLAELAGDGAALEFGIGTGRIGLPLAARGVAVHGIELSQAMVERMRAKPGGDAAGVTIGDFATAEVDREFAVVYLVFNAINNVTTQAGQTACFANAARHLAPGGHFVIEVGIPRLQRLPVGQTVVVDDLSEDHLGLDEYDVLGQGLVSHHFNREPDGRYALRSIPFRYVWPAELDLMARLAGMTLVHRWCDWDRAALTAESTSHVSIWRRD
jgi:SAM-dependent methyltransferase